MRLYTAVHRRKADIIRVSRRHGARNVRVFGSVARGDETPTSDIDFVVDLDRGRSLLDLGGLLVDLEKLLRHPVDVVTEKGLRPRIRDRVLKEAIPL